MKSSNYSMLSERLWDLENEWESNWEAFGEDETMQVDPVLVAKVADEFAERMKENYPFFHPRYAGQMLKPPHPIAAAAYQMAMKINPNNHALDGGPATAKMEIEVVADLARMFGYKKHLGHLTSSGTIANLEALWIARSLHPNKGIAFSASAHYTHKRMCEVIRAEAMEIPSDEFGRMDCDALEKALKSGNVGTVVATIGTTSIGALDPLEKIIPLCRKYNVACPCRCRVRRILHAACTTTGYRLSMPRHISISRNVTASLSTRTSMVCSRTGAAAYCSATRPSENSTNTIRRTPTSLRTICISVKSASNARVPVQRQPHCGLR